jgi:hypothetical protein
LRQDNRPPLAKFHAASGPAPAPLRRRLQAWAVGRGRESLRGLSARTTRRPRGAGAQVPMQARSRLPGRRALRRWPLLKPAARVVPAIKCQPTYKPGSVWRVAPPRRPFVWDAACAAPQATNPGGGRDCAWTARSPRKVHVHPNLRAAPIRSCSRWGLPCRLRHRRRGALLPHRFTLTPVG